MCGIDNLFAMSPVRHSGSMSTVIPATESIKESGREQERIETADTTPGTLLLDRRPRLWFVFVTRSQTRSHRAPVCWPTQAATLHVKLKQHPIPHAKSVA